MSQDQGEASAPPDAHIDRAASLNYWNSVPATSGAMLAALGDYPWYTRIDLRGSKTFLGKVRRLVPGCTTDGKLTRGADCGAGVGRVSEGFLSHVCETLDAVEPVEQFTRVIEESSLKQSGVVDKIYRVGLEDWYPEEKYDLIWTQFCVGHLTDVQVVEYLQRCRAALTDTGVLIFKENQTTDADGEDIYDDEDSSVTRTEKKFRSLFKQGGMNVIASELQLGFPKSFKLFPVRFYALRPTA